MIEQPSEIEKAMTPLDVMTLVGQVAARARHVANGRLHDDDCESEANEAVVIALRECPDRAGLLQFARVVVGRGVVRQIERQKRFVNLDAAGWREADESTPGEHDAYADGDVVKFRRDNFTVAEEVSILRDAGAGDKRTSELTGVPRRRVQQIPNRKRNDARTKTQPVNERSDRRRAPVPRLA